MPLLPEPLSLPWPPTVNQYWRSLGRGRVVLSQKAREYKKAVKDTVLAHHANLGLSCPISIAVALHPPSKHRRDIDNYCKGLLDALTAAGVWQDDRQVKRLLVEMQEPTSGGRVDIILREWT